MSSRGYSTGRRAARMIQFLFIALFVIALIYSVYWMATRIIWPATETECRRRLQVIANGLQEYLSDHQNHWPQYLTELYPNYVKRKEYFICPADKNHGTQGCIPAWMRNPALTGNRPFDDKSHYVDLDGPTMSSADKDSFPCSYLYENNQYPCFVTFVPGEQPFKHTWSEFKDYQRFWVRQKGLVPEHVLPVVRCFHHLKQGAKRSDGPTFNILLNLSTDIKEYPYDWQNAFKALTAPEATPAAAKTPARRTEN